MCRSTCSRKLLGAIVLFGILLPGCALFQSPPQAELGAFRQAVDQARVAGDQVLDLYAVDVAANDALRVEAGLVGPRVDRTFDPQGVIDAAQNSPDAIEARRGALLVIEKYAEMLVALAEGKSAEEVKASAAGLFSSIEVIGGFVGSVPAIGLALPLVQTVLSQLEAARTVAEFRAATVDGERVVQKLTVFLKAETGDYYELALSLYDARRGPLLRTTSTSIQQILAIAREHRTPAETEFAEDLKKDLDAALATTTFAIETFEISWGGTAALDATSRSQLRSLLQEVKRASQREQVLIEALHAQRSLLETYVLLLARVDTTLAQLRAALDKPLNLQAQFDAIDRLATRLRQDIAVLRSKRENQT